MADHIEKENALNTLVEKTSTKGLSNEHTYTHTLLIYNFIFIPDEQKWWNRFDESNKNYTDKQSKTLNIEITSYGLLAMLESGRFSDGFPYFKWLLSQRNNKGGFIGTQDTVLGLQALAKFAERISIDNNNVQIAVHTNDLTNDTNFNINPENVLIYQSYELPSSIRTINITANGHGFALFQLSYSYHINTTEANPSFLLKSRILDGSNAAYLKLDTCVT